jgi:hypothetical protein
MCNSHVIAFYYKRWKNLTALAVAHESVVCFRHAQKAYKKYLHELWS